ncbi:MAG: acyltransferase [Spirochaetia bacterium]|jgi:UDP-2-acetamido-3-amino-2,3-dideoxy-glucuronate N-acetyltransferase|nr:acyltransferase [Spirochaetia bacterium]
MQNGQMIQMPAVDGGAWKRHESSYVDEGALVGPGTKVWHFCHVMAGAKIGANCSLGQNVNVGSRAIIGDSVKIQNNVSVYDDVIIEDEVFCGPSCVFTNVINPRAFVERKNEYRTTIVRRGASIGANATIVCGVSLGEYCLIGAGSVVTKDVPAYALVYGCPARQQGWVCRCGNVLDDHLLCKACGSHYAKTGKGLSSTGENRLQ